MNKRKYPKKIQYYICPFLLFLFLCSGVQAQTPSGKEMSNEKAQSLMLSSKASLLPDSLISAKAHHDLMAIQLDSTNVAALVELSHIYTLIGNLNQAISYAQRAYDESGKDEYTGSTLMSLAMRMGNADLAAKIGEELLERKPENLKLLQNLSSVYMAQKRSDKAIEMLQRLNELVGDNAELTYNIAKVLAETGKEEDIQKAMDLLKNYVQRHPLDSQAYISLLAFLSEHDLSNEALELLNTMPKKQQELPHMQFIKSTVYAQLGEYPNAAKSFFNAAKMEGSTPELMEATLDRLSTFATKGGSSFYNAFIPVLEKLVKEYDASANLEVYLAQMFFSNGNETKGKALFEQMVTEKAKTPDPYLFLAQKALESKDFDKLETICDTAIEVLPARAEFYIYKAISLTQKDQNEAALSVIEQAREAVNPAEPLFAQILLIQADLLNELGKVKEAVEVYEKAYIFMPNDANMLNNYAYALATGGGDLEKAEELASKAVKLKPSEGTILDTYAWVLYLRGNYSLAKIYIESAIRNSEEPSATLHEHRGDILIQLEENDSAIEAWQKAIELGGDKKALEKKIKKAKAK